MYEKVIILHEYFTQVVFNNMNFEYKPKISSQSAIKNFVKRLSSSHGDDWLFNYFNFHFSRYYKMKTRFEKQFIPINWIAGIKSFNHYKNATNEEKHYAEIFKCDFEISNPLIKKNKIIILNSTILNVERKRFYNTDRGLLHCKELKLYRELNINCMMCKNKNYCK